MTIERLLKHIENNHDPEAYRLRELIAEHNPTKIPHLDAIMERLKSGLRAKGSEAELDGKTLSFYKELKKELGI